MSKKLYEATLLQLKGKALAEVAAMERLLRSTEGSAEVLMEHAQQLTLYENAMTVLQAYIGPYYQPSPEPPQALPAAPAESVEPPGEPRVITPEMSSTYAASVGQTEAVTAKRRYVPVEEEEEE